MRRSSNWLTIAGVTWLALGGAFNSFGQSPVAPCTTDRQLGAITYTASQTVAASNFISASGVVTAGSGINVGFQAGSEICFGPGFHFTASSGGYISALISALPAISISGPATLPNGVQGHSYSASGFSATGGTGSYTWSVANGPSGLTVNGSGQLTGSPTTTGLYASFTITATDAVETSVASSRTIPLTIATPLSETGLPLPYGVATQYYSQVVAGAGGTPPYAWQPATLFANVAIASNGTISGTPQSVGGYAFNLMLTDSGSPPQTATFAASISVNALPGLTSATLPNAASQQPYSQQIALTGGVPPYSWSATGLPSGLTLPETTGIPPTLSGTPTALSGTFSITVTVTDSAHETTSATYSLTILPSFQLSDLTHSGATSPYLAGDSFLVTMYGAANTPIYLSTNGGSFAQYPGSATTDANGRFQVGGTWSDANVCSGACSYTQVWRVGSQNAIINNNLALSAFIFQIQASTQVTVQLTDTTTGATYQGGERNYRNSDSFALLVHGPAGGTVTNNGVTYCNGTTTVTDGNGMCTAAGSWVGTPAGTYPQTWAVNGVAAPQISFTLSGSASEPVITTSSLPGGIVGAGYSQALSVSGGATPYTWALTGTLPPGLALNSPCAAGVICGTPTATGLFSFSITATDINSNVSTPQSLSINVAPVNSLSILTSSLPGGTVGVTYPPSGTSGMLTASGGTAPYTWSVSSGALPGGLTLNSSTGAISGTPGANGAFSFTVTVSDSASHTAPQNLSILVAPVPVPVTEYIRLSGRIVATEHRSQ